MIAEILTFCSCFCSSVFSQVPERKNADLSGTWYPREKGKLLQLLDRYFSEAEVSLPAGRILGIISPHAGIQFSGPVAAYGFKALSGKKIKTAVVVGFTHRKNFPGMALYTPGVFETPLGDLVVDTSLAQQILSFSKRCAVLPDAFQQENSLELQLPFLKKALPSVSFVPIVFGSQNYQDCEILAEALSKILTLREDVAVIFSTDLSHFHSYNTAVSLDRKTVQYIEQLKAKELFDEILRGEQLCCGFMPVVTALLLAKKFDGAQIAILKYANSGDTSGQKDEVVGYVSAALLIPENKPEAKNISEISSQKKDTSDLSMQDKDFLLAEARSTLEVFLSQKRVPDFEPKSAVLLEKRGAFVTLRKQGALRGCIGNLSANTPLYQTIRSMAIEAATGDPRFSPVAHNELGNITIEISVLSPLRRVNDSSEIILGTHGVLVRRGFRQGVFLPQVALETGWNKEEFLSYLCSEKAGLSSDCWKEKGTELFVFSADVFSESER